MIEALATLLVALLRALVPALVTASRETVEEGAPAVELRDRLRQRVRETWGVARAWTLIPIAVCLFYGCATRAVYVPDGTPVRLRETIRDAKVWVLDKDGQPVAGEMDLPEGWYALPAPGQEEED